MSLPSIFGLVLLIACIFAIIKITKSSESTLIKIVWIVGILLLPFIGLIVWFFIGPGDKSLKL